MAITSSSSSSDNGVPSCSGSCSKAYDQLHSQYDKLTVEFCKSQIDVLSYQAGLESVEARLVSYRQNESILQENINMLKNEVKARDNVLVTLKQKLNQAKKERDDLTLKFDKFQTSSKSLTELLASQTNNKHGLGYFSKNDSKSLSTSSLSDRIQPSGGYHAVLPPIIGTFMPSKPDLFFHTAPIAVETDHSAFTVKLSPFEPTQDLSHTNRPSAPIIEECVSDSKDESETTTPQIAPSFVQSTEQVKPPRHSVQPVKTSIPAATPKPTSPKSNGSGKRKNRKTCFVCKSMDHLTKDCDYHAKKKAQPTPRNYTHRGNHKQYASLTHKKLQNHMAPTAVLTQSKPVFNTAVRPVGAAVPKIMVTRPRLAYSPVTKCKSPIRPHITHSPSPKTSNSPPKVIAVKAPVVNVVQGIKGKWIKVSNGLGPQKILTPQLQKKFGTNYLEYFLQPSPPVETITSSKCPKPTRSKNQRDFVEGTWSDSGDDEEEETKDESCLVAQASNEICLGINFEPEEWIKDSGCSKHMTGNRKLFSTYKAYTRSNFIFRSNLRGNVIGKGHRWIPAGRTISMIVEIVLWYLDSGCSKHMTGQRDKLINLVYKFIGLGHNLLSVGQFCDSDLEVAFRKHTYSVRNLDGIDLLLGRGSNLYAISMEEIMESSPICLLSKASKTKSWLWHHHLSHLNFETIN
nr:integrase, catalytic region, zinc finger, CCHC-type, peptidase aspartic, catalytic [Tanacetum cinerariifolium]